MVDLKISELTNGGAVQVNDQIPVNRGGANFRVSVDTSKGSQFDAVVAPTGGDYTTVKDAIDAGNVAILVKGGTTTESASFTFSATTWIHINADSEWSLSTFSMSSASNDISLVITGDASTTEGDPEGSKLISTATAGTAIDMGGNIGTGLEIKNVICEKLSGPNNRMGFAEQVSLNNVYMNLGGFNTGFAASSRVFVNSCFIEGSSSAYQCIIADEVFVNGLFVSGSIDSTASRYVISSTTQESLYNNISVNSDCNMQLSGVISNVTYSGGNTLNIDTDNTVSAITAVACNNLEINNVADVHITSCEIDGTLTTSNANGTSISACRIIGLTTLGGDNIRLGDCELQSGASVTGNRLGASNCKFGGFGGASTITINAGSDDAILTGCHFDVAPVDNGTGTVETGNVII